MRIVARRARSFQVHDVKAMPAALTLTVDCAEALITKDTVAAVTFVTEGIVGLTFRRVVCENQLALQKRRVNGTMRAIRAGATRSRTLVAVVAVCTFHGARDGPWRDQAGHVPIVSHGFNGVERLIGHTEL